MSCRCRLLVFQHVEKVPHLNIPFMLNIQGKWHCLIEMIGWFDNHAISHLLSLVFAGGVDFQLENSKGYTYLRGIWDSMARYGALWENAWVAFSQTKCSKPKQSRVEKAKGNQIMTWLCFHYKVQWIYPFKFDRDKKVNVRGEVHHF